MRKYLLLGLAVVLVGALVLAGCAQQAPSPTPSPAPKPSPSPAPAPSPSPSPTAPVAQVIELKLAHTNPPKSRAQVNFMEPWVKDIENASKGRLKITIFAAGALHKAEETLTSLQRGVMDMTWQTSGIFPGRFPLTNGTTLPFMNLPEGKLNGKKISGGAVNSRIIQELYEKFPEMQAEFADYKVLFLHASDPYFLATTKKPVKTIADLKGLKIRELAGPPLEMYRLLGASPVNIPMPEIYEAASKGVIDGAGQIWSSLQSFKLYEVFGYRTIVSANTAAFFVMMNKDKWNSLPKDLQDIITKYSGIYGAEFAGDQMFGFETEAVARDQMQKSGKIMQDLNLDPGEKEKWEEIAGKPLQKSWVEDMNKRNLPGQKFLDEMNKLIAKYK